MRPSRRLPPSAFHPQAGFGLLVDTPTGLPGQRVVQVTPPGSACSIGFGTGITAAEPGSQQRLHLVVTDVVAARDELTGHGVEVGEVRHIADGEWRPGPDPDRANYMSFAGFSDPDGNLWLLQEVRRDRGRVTARLDGEPAWEICREPHPLLTGWAQRRNLACVGKPAIVPAAGSAPTPNTSPGSGSPPPPSMSPHRHPARSPPPPGLIRRVRGNFGLVSAGLAAYGAVRASEAA
jgi:hypothetical protein